MVGLISSAIAPALVISVATRVQSQKAEQALEIAQSEIDQVRLLVERNTATLANLPDAVDGVVNSEVASFGGPNYGAPIVNPAVRPTALQTREVSLGTDSNQFAVQVYRTGDNAVLPVTFSVGVRVYDLDAVLEGTGNLSTDPASLSMVGGVGDRASRPLVALYTNITAAETGSSLCSYFESLNDAAAVPFGCN
jgi:type II secretory pathway pseudopilin PulG